MEDDEEHARAENDETGVEQQEMECAQPSANAGDVEGHGAGKRCGNE